MSDRTTQKKKEFVIDFIYISIIISLAFIAVKYSFLYIYPFIISLVVGIIIEPFVATFQDKLRLSRAISSFICIALFYIVVFVFLFLVILAVYSSMKALVANAAQTIETINEYVELISLKTKNNTASIIEIIAFEFSNYIKSLKLDAIIGGRIGTGLIEFITGIIKSVPQVSIGMLVSIVASYFVTLNFSDIKNFLLKQLSQKHQKILHECKRVVTKILKNYLKSYLILMALTFLELVVLFSIFKIKPAIVLAFFISLVDILPVLGVGSILIPWSIICLVTGNVTKATVLISIYILVTVVRNTAEPKIISQNIGLNPLITIITIFIGFKLFGIIGLILLPIIAMLIIELNKSGVIKLWKNAIDKKN